MLAAEFGFHAALRWGEPACALDAYVEFRHYVNNGSVKGGDREKGFYSIGGALRYFLEDEIDVTRKHDMRERILQGPPFSAQEQRDILDYCEDDVRALARLFRISFRPFARRFLTRYSAPSFSGRSRSRSGAAFRWTVRCSPVCATNGRISGSIWSPSWIARSAATRSSTAWRIGVGIYSPTTSAGTE